MSNYVNKECQVHGEQRHVYEKRGKNPQRLRCVKCRSEAVLRRRHLLKLKAIAYKGGACSLCGYNKCVAALEFHHRDPSQKDFGVSAKGITRSWKTVTEELDKCDLICANCHREIHSDEINPDRMSLKTINHTCQFCKKAFSTQGKTVKKYCCRECTTKAQTEKKKQKNKLNNAI